MRSRSSATRPSRRRPPRPRWRSSPAATPLLFAIVDVGLPDGRGDALAIELRKLRAELPIIIATGYDQSHLDERARNHPLTAVLNKPYDIAQLQAAIDKIAGPA